jgi:hypothetical protein
MELTITTIKIITCWAKKPTTSAAVFIRNETIEPIIPGKADADFLAISFSHSANFFNPSFTLSGIDGSGFGGPGSGAGAGVFPEPLKAFFFF